MDTEDRVLGCVTGPSLNHHTFDYRQVAARLGTLLNRLATRIKVQRTALPDQTVRAVLSIAGAATDEDRALIEFCLHLNDWKLENYEVVDDTWAGLVAGTLTYSGTCAFAGTGASVYSAGDAQNTARFQGKPNKIDGWGPIIGDFGSGFQLAVEMFRFFGRYHDQNGTVPPLFNEALKVEPGIMEITNVQQWFDAIYIEFDKEWRIRFARLAEVATRAADRKNPDRQAVKLVTDSATAMVRSIKIALKRCKGAKHRPIVLQGGMFEYSKLYRRIVAVEIAKVTGSKIVLAKYKPTVGALIMARFPNRAAPDRAIIERIEGSILHLLVDEQKDLLRLSRYSLESGNPKALRGGHG